MPLANQMLGFRITLLQYRVFFLVLEFCPFPVLTGPHHSTLYLLTKSLVGLSAGPLAFPPSVDGPRCPTSCVHRCSGGRSGWHHWTRCSLRAPPLTREAQALPGWRCRGGFLPTASEKIETNLWLKKWQLELEPLIRKILPSPNSQTSPRIRLKIRYRKRLKMPPTLLWSSWIQSRI